METRQVRKIMRLKTDWLIQEPIDLEHKQYVLLDYISKVNEDFGDMKLYPSFQELALHLANTGRILEYGELVTLNREPEEIDDEIMLDDLTYEKIKVKEADTFKEIIDITNYSKDKLTDLFLIGKSIWSLIYDSVTIKIVHNSPSDTKLKPGKGFFYLIYEEELYIYQYGFRQITKKHSEHKCDIDLIYQGKVIDVTNIESLISLIKQNHMLKEDSKGRSPYEQIDNVLPIFRVRHEQNFPLEGAILSIAKRKVINYIFQTIKITELKND